MSPQKMIQLLREGVCKVNFTKLSGEVRDMTCSLNFDFIPDDKMPKGELQRPGEVTAHSAIRAFDTDLQEWRSFRVSSVNMFQLLKPVEDEVVVEEEATDEDTPEEE